MDVRTAAAPGPTSIINGYQDFREGKIDSPPGLVIVDDTTFRVLFDTPNAGFVPSISFLGFQILPEHILGSVDPSQLEQHPFFQNPTVASGAFKYVKYETDQFVQVERNPNFYGSPAKLERLFVRTSTSDVATAQLQKGEILHTQISVTDAETLKSMAGHQSRQQTRGGHLPDGAVVRRPEVQRQARASGAGVRHRPPGHRQPGVQGLRPRRQQPHHRPRVGHQSEPQQVRVQPRPRPGAAARGRLGCQHAGGHQLDGRSGRPRRRELAADRAVATAGGGHQGRLPAARARSAARGDYRPQVRPGVLRRRRVHGRSRQHLVRADEPVHPAQGREQRWLLQPERRSAVHGGPRRNGPGQASRDLPGGIGR